MAARTLLVVFALVLVACAETPASEGEAVAIDVGCVTCHMEADTDLAPTLHGIFGTSIGLEDGTMVTVDDAYVRRSILEPQAQIVAGYGDSRMPTFVLSDEEVEALVDYVRSLG